MRQLASPSFWQAYAALPGNIQELANKNFDLLKANPHHPSLHLKKVAEFWSVRIGKRHRALAIETQVGMLWFWIGSHSEYDKLIRKS